MKQIKDYPHYFVTKEGKVINSKSGRILKQDINSCGYARVTLCMNNKTKKFFVHRLVAKAYLEEPDNGLYQVNHKDGNKQNNNIANLEWCNQSLNQIHAHENGLQPRVTKISEEDAHDICSKLEDGWSTKDILWYWNEYQLGFITRDIIQDIKRKKTWPHVTKHYNF